MSRHRQIRAVCCLALLILGGMADAARIGAFTPRETPPATPEPATPAIAPATPATPAASITPAAPTIPTTSDPLQARETELMAALAKPPVDLDLIRELASLRARRAITAHDRSEEALAFDLLTNSLSLDPLQPEHWERLGDWSLDLASPDGTAMAHHAYRQVLDLVPDQPRAHLKLAAISADRGEHTAAIEHIERALASPRTEIPDWNQLTLLNQLYLRARRAGQGLAFLGARFEATSDDRYLLAQAVLMDAIGQGQPAARIAAAVAGRKAVPEALRLYAERLAARFTEAGNSRLYGKAGATQDWGTAP